MNCARVCETYNPLSSLHTYSVPFGLASIGSVHPSESGTIAAFRVEKGESQLDGKGNVVNTFNQLLTCRIDIYSPFSSIITLIDPNQIGGSRGDTSAARFEYWMPRTPSRDFVVYPFITSVCNL